MMTQDQLATLQGTAVYDRNGDKIGSVGQVYTAGDPDRPLWASVNMGLFGARETLVPLTDAEMNGADLRVPFEKSFVTDAPNVDVGVAEPVSVEDAQRLYQHYQPGNQSGDARTGEPVRRYVARDSRRSGDVRREDFES